MIMDDTTLYLASPRARSPPAAWRKRWFSGRMCGTALAPTGAVVSGHPIQSESRGSLGWGTAPMYMHTSTYSVHTYSLRVRIVIVLVGPSCRRYEISRLRLSGTRMAFRGTVLGWASCWAR